MDSHAHHILPGEDQQNVDASWFNEQERNSRKDEHLRAWLHEEIIALKAFHDGTADAKETANMITRPISTSPVPWLGTYSDETVALTELWTLLVRALMEWPANRRSSLFALLYAIGKVPDLIHAGEATDSEGKEKLTWAMLPYFGTVWYEASSLRPGVIVRRSPDATALEKARVAFVKQRDIEAELWANRLIGRDEGSITDYIIGALEGTPDKSVATNNVTADEQIRLEFHIPAVNSWMRYAGLRIFKYVVRTHGEMRLELWEKRLQDILEQELDDCTKAAAASALSKMQAVREGSSTQVSVG